MSHACLAKEKLFTVLRDRAAMLASVRHFFSNRAVLEVDCPLMGRGAIVDAYIDPFVTQNSATESLYLHTSPEWGMKQLLAQGIGDIFQLSHVFRKGEVGRRHQPEFTMVEWYRLGVSLEHLIVETLDLIRLFVGEVHRGTLTFRQALYRYASLTDDAIDRLNDHEIDLVWCHQVEPQLGKNELTVITHWPASRRALAKTAWVDGYEVALRFEVFYNGYELANGYDELLNPEEHERRFAEANSTRREEGKDLVRVGEAFMEAVRQGLPPCCGVAVGFDRLMMVRHQTDTLADVIPFCVLG